MESKIEGLILSKMPYQERHLLTTILLRSGKKITAIFYGGRGGGKKQKSSIVELGFMCAMELRSTNENSEIYYVKEWSLIWNHAHIRNNSEAFYTMCFFLEICNKISQEENLHNVHSHDLLDQGIFVTLSNALVICEKSLALKCFFSSEQIIIFLAKICMHLGVFPTRENCQVCDVKLNLKTQLYLQINNGGFVCSNCEINLHAVDEKMLWEILGLFAHEKYSELYNFKISDPTLAFYFAKQLFTYFCYHNHFERFEFKTTALLKL